jgi:uncharacterized RDD family membrane protein YckC
MSDRPPDWYYALNNQQHGPVPVETIQQMLAGGQLHGGDLLWREGMAQWTAAGAIEDFAALAPPAPLGYATATTGADLLAAAFALRYGGFWERFVAWLIDAVVTGIPNWIIGYLIGVIGGTFNSTPAVRAGIFGLSTLIGYTIPWLYEALMTASPHQATLGKMAMGLFVTDIHGNRISFGRATGRHFGKILSGLIFLAGFIMAAFTERKQGLHDILAGTVVLKRG